MSRLAISIYTSAVQFCTTAQRGSTVFPVNRIAVRGMLMDLMLVARMDQYQECWSNKCGCGRVDLRGSFTR